MLGTSQELHHRHESVGGDRGQDVPPAVKLEYNAPRKTKLVLQAGNAGAEMDVDVPESVGKKGRRCVCGQHFKSRRSKKWSHTGSQCRECV